jgi:hypothetical protein
MANKVAKGCQLWMKDNK